MISESVYQRAIVGLLAVASASAAVRPDPARGDTTRPAPSDPPRIERLWVSSGVDYANTDSLATLRVGGAGRVYATVKEGDRLDVFDAGTGAFRRSVGDGEGEAPGQLDRPNDVIAVKLPAPWAAESVRRLIVVERNNHRIQAFTPRGESKGVFGTEALNRPYGATVAYTEEGARLFVTDTEVAPEKKLKVFSLRQRDGKVAGRHLDTFGEAAGPGRLGEIETLLFASGRLFVSDESAKHLKVYTGDGSFTGHTVGEGLIRGDPEGLALLEAPGGQVLIVTDQRESITVWHAFDPATLAHRLSFTGEAPIADTDGIAVYPHPVPGDDRGALIAVHRDRDLRAFGLSGLHRLLERSGRP